MREKRESEKATKAEVDYGPGHRRGDHCGICRHFQSYGNKCDLVRGAIHAADWCKLFEAKRPKAA